MCDAPDHGWLPFLKMLFGFAALATLAAFCVAAFCVIIAVGNVSEQTSYGLMPIITCLAALCGGFTQWAFGGKSDDRNGDV